MRTYLTRWLAALAETDGARFLAAAVVGVILGTLLVSLSRQSALLEDLYILAHEQRRMAFAAAARERAKEHGDNA